MIENALNTMANTSRLASGVRALLNVPLGKTSIALDFMFTEIFVALL